jgi:hypothetical protein
MRALDDIVQNHPMSRILAVGALVSVAPLIATLYTAAAVDLGLALVAVGGASATGWLAWQKHLAAGLPLELAPSAAVGVVDGQRIVRFRARLGLGRSLRATAQVRFVPTVGAPRPVHVACPEGAVCGPFVICVVAVDEPGAYEVDVVGAEGDRTWSARATYAASAVREGRFTGGIHPGPVRFGPGWDVVGE